MNASEREIHTAETAMEMEALECLAANECTDSRASAQLTTETVEEKEVKLQLMSACQRDKLAAEYLHSCAGPELHVLSLPTLLYYHFLPSCTHFASRPFDCTITSYPPVLVL